MSAVVLVGPDPGVAPQRVVDDPEIKALLASRGEIRISRHGANSPGFLAELNEADFLYLTGFLPTGSLAGVNGRLRLISVTATGYHNYVDVDEAHSHGIEVAYVPSYGDEAVAEHALAMLLALAKRLPMADALVKGGGWGGPESLQLAGATAGVVGLGGVGARVVRLLEALGMDVLVWNRTRDDHRLAGTRARYVELNELFASADAVSLHLALRAETEGMITGGLLASMKPGAILVNTARAEIVAPGALETAVREGRIRAGVDVFRQEPPDRHDPLLGLGEGVLLSPHVAFNTPESARALFVGTARNLANFGTDRICHLAPRS